MTRKDYLLISDAIVACNLRIQRTRFDPRPGSKYVDPADQAQQLAGVRKVAAHLADALKADHPAGFDLPLFLTNCGYGATGPVEPAPEGQKPIDPRGDD